MSPTPSFWTLAPWTAVDWANHLWQSTVVALVLLGLLRFCERLSARTRLAIAWLAVGKFIVPFAVLGAVKELLAGTMSQSVAASPEMVSELARPSALSAAALSTTANGPLFPFAIPVSLPGATVFFWLWLAGFGVLAAGWCIRARRVQRQQLSHLEPASPGLIKAIDETLEIVGLRERPRCVVSREGHGPALVGLFSPVIVLPRGLEDALTPAELRAVLAHEFMHLCWRDPVFGALRTLIVGLLWFNPVAWLLNRRLRLETEKACDERVVEVTPEPEIYASGIVKTVQHSLGLFGPGITGVTTPPVVSRLKAILAPPPAQGRHFYHLLAVATALTLMGVASGGSALLARAVAAGPGFSPTIASVAPIAPSAPLAVATASGSAVTATSEPPPAPTAPAPAPAQKSPDDTTLSIDFIDTDIRDLIRNVAELFQINIVLPEDLHGKTTIQLRDVTWRQVFKAALEPKGYTFLKEGNIVRIVPLTPPPASMSALDAPAAPENRPRAAPNQRTTEINGQRRPAYILQPGDVLRLQVFQHTELGRDDLKLSPRSTIHYPPLGTLDLLEKDVRQTEIMVREALARAGVADPQVNISVFNYSPRKPPVSNLSIDFRDTDIATLIRNVADLSTVKVIIPVSLQGRTTVTLRDVTWQEIFKTVLEPAGYSFMQTGDVVTIFRLEAVPEVLAR